jgi:hypothetical protein
LILFLQGVRIVPGSIDLLATYLFLPPAPAFLAAVGEKMRSGEQRT